MADGSELVDILGSFHLAARPAQELKTRQFSSSRTYIEANSGHFPAIADQLADAFRIGVVPSFDALAETRMTNHPRERKNTPLAIETIWEDVAAGDMFL